MTAAAVGGTSTTRAAAVLASFIAQLGDLIDGMNAATGQSEAALGAALAHLDRVPCPKINILGNHELYNFNRKRCAERLNTAPSGSEFYSMVPAAGFRVIVLDAYQESIILPAGNGAESERRELSSSEQFQRTLALLQANNPNDLRSNCDWSKGLTGDKRRFMPFNGGLGAKQLSWFRAELTAAAAAREKVLVLSHVILHPRACDGTTMLYDYEAALDAIAAAGCVVGVLCGHDHRGGYHKDARGVHHLTFQSPLNKGADGHAYGLLAVHHDRFVVSSPALADFLPSAVFANGTLPTPQTKPDGSQWIALPFA